MPKNMGGQSGVDPGSAAFKRGSYGGGSTGMKPGSGGPNRGNQSFVDRKAAPPSIGSGRNGPGGVSKGNPKRAKHPGRSKGSVGMKSYSKGY